MAFDVDKALDISENGVLVSNNDGTGLVWIGGGVDSPVGYQAPVGSRYYQTNGKVFKKFSTGVSDWRIYPLAEEVPFDNSTNLFDSNYTQQAVEEIDFREIFREPTGFCSECALSIISFNDSLRRFSIAPTSTEFVYYTKGHKHVKTSIEHVVIDDTDGNWYIYYDGSSLLASQTEWEYGAGVVFVSIVYWDSTNKKAIYFGDERHGLTMDWATHKRLHLVYGMGVERNKLVAGDYILNGNGSLDSHCQLSLTDGTIHDEDLVFDVENSVTPTNPFEQEISPIVHVPIYYQIGSTGIWRKLDATHFPVASQSGFTCRYNYYNPTTEQWGLVNASEEFYFTVWLFATNNIYEPIVAVLGQKQYVDPLTADAEEQYAFLDLTNFPFLESALLYRCMFRTSTIYTNTPNAILVNLLGVNVPNNLAQAISNKKLTSQTVFETSSTTDVEIANFHLTPEAGTYALFYSADQIIVQNNADAFTTIYIDDSRVDDSERSVQGVGSNFNCQTSIVTTIGVNGSQRVNVRVRVDVGVFKVKARTAVLIRLGAA